MGVSVVVLRVCCLAAVAPIVRNSEEAEKKNAAGCDQLAAAIGES